MKNKALISHCHGNEHGSMGGTHPFQTWSRPFLDSFWVLGEDDCLHVHNN